jgi:hypothetical protein
MPLAARARAVTSGASFQHTQHPIDVSSRETQRATQAAPESFLTGGQ